MIPFNIPPYVKESSDYIAQAIANRKICGDGPFTKRCNQQLEEMTGACKALLTTSGTSAMELAALLQGTVPLGLLLAARVLHFVFLQGLLHLCLPLVPGQAAVFTSLAPQVVVMKRAAWDTALAIAFFLCAALYQLYKTCQSSYNNTIPAAHRSRADGPR